jgi:3-oxoadipate enol-lactonase
MILSGDVPLFVRTDGDDRRPAVLLINPLGTTLEMWDPYVEALVAHNWVVRFDLRGHGRSVEEVGAYDVADLGADAIAVLDALDIPRAHVVGASLGGLAATWMASEHPDRVDRLVLAGTSCRLGPDRWWERTIENINAGGLRSVCEHLESVFFSPEWVAAMPEEAEAARDMLLATPTDAYLAGAGCIMRADVTENLAGIRAATLVVVGENDPVLHHHPATDLLDGIRDSEAVQVGGARHRVLLEQPEAIAGVVTEFLTDIDGR